MDKSSNHLAATNQVTMDSMLWYGCDYINSTTHRLAKS